MKILELQLKNFSRVLTGLGKTLLNIDLTKSENRVHLFAGANGSGKTSIMSCFHPFAFNNTMDNRDNSQLIIDGKSGEKIIVLDHKQTIYTIRHLYKRNNSGSLLVKSYISDGVMDLNPAGNVTEFKELIFELFGLDETFLSLLTLGVNVSGFIDKSGTDRKNFSAKIFEELGIYNTHYKRVNNNARVLKSLMTNISSKLVKYKNIDIEDLKKTLKQLEIRERKVYDEIRQVTSDTGSINSLIDTKTDTINAYETKKYKLSGMIDELTRLRASKNVILSKLELEESIRDLNSKKFDSKVLKTSIESRMISLLDGINSKTNTRDNLKLNESKLTSNRNYDDMIKLRTSLEIDIESLRLSLVGWGLSGYSREELIRATVYLDELMNQCGDLLMIDDELALRVYNKYKVDKKLEDNALKSLADTTFNIKNYELLKMNNIDNLDTNLEGDCTDSNCPYKKFYLSYMSYIRTNNSQALEELDKAKDAIHSLEEIIKTINIIKRVKSFVNNTPVLLELPSDIFNKDTFIESYIKTKEAYNKTTLVNLIDKLEDQDKLLNLMDKLDNVNEQIVQYQDSKDVIDNLTNQITLLSNEIDNDNNDLETHRTSIANVISELNKIEFDLDDKLRQLEVIESIEIKKIEINKLSDEIREMDYTMEDINKLLSKRSELRSRDIQLNEERNTISRELSNIRMTINDYENLKHEEAEVDAKYDKYIAIREALSPSKGIPTIFIETYVKNMATYINELLDLVYEGTLRICPNDIIVDDNEFSIPYIKNGTKINDICSASQGERAFLSLAFSLAMLKLSSGEYNIMLLDEADTTLDTISRSKFIPILENYLDSIGAEQVFVISHNNMFDSYPIELVLTSPDNTTNKGVNNVIELY